MARYDHQDPALRTGEGGLTVWKLRQMAQEKRFDELNDLFNDGLSMNALPVGYAAGAAARVADVDNEVVADVLDGLAGENWRGKIFFSSNDKNASKGRNRIRKSVLLPNAPIVPMARFDAYLVQRDVLTPEARSNLVVLNYADPETRPYWQELALNKAPVYDVMVATRGRYGPVFVGKTWLGKYDEHKRFVASTPDQLICWYFLDFNPGALAEQRERHWDGSEEEMLDPLPHVDNRSWRLTVGTPRALPGPVVRRWNGRPPRSPWANTGAIGGARVRLNSTARGSRTTASTPARVRLDAIPPEVHSDSAALGFVWIHRDARVRLVFAVLGFARVSAIGAPAPVILPRET